MPSLVRSPVEPPNSFTHTRRKLPEGPQHRIPTHWTERHPHGLTSYRVDVPAQRGKPQLVRLAHRSPAAHERIEDRQPRKLMPPVKGLCQPIALRKNGTE